MMMSPLLDRNDSQLVCCVLPGTDFIARMLPLLNIMFGSSGHSLSTVNCAPHLSLLLLCSVFLQNYSLRFCLFPSIFHVARYLSVIITHTPPPPLVGKKLACLRPIHAYMHAYIHTYIDTYHLFTHHPSFSHTIFHIVFDPSPPPLSFLPSR